MVARSRILFQDLISSVPSSFISTVIGNLQRNRGMALVGFSEQIKVLFISRLVIKLCKIVLVFTGKSYSGASDGVEVLLLLSWHQRRHKY